MKVQKGKSKNEKSGYVVEGKPDKSEKDKTKHAGLSVNTTCYTMIINPTCHGYWQQPLSLCSSFSDSSGALLCFARAVHKPCPVPVTSEESHTLKYVRFHTS